MKNYILMGFEFLFVVALLGCKPSSVGCAVETQVAKGTSDAIVSTFGCANSAAVIASVTAELNKTGVCSSAPAGIIGGTVCPMLANLLISDLGNVLPSSWACTPTGAEAALNTVALAGCQLIPFKPHKK